MPSWLWRVGLLAIVVFAGWCVLTIVSVQRMRADLEEHVGWLIEIQSILEASERDDPQWLILRDRLALLRDSVYAHPDSLGDASDLRSLAADIDNALAVIPPDWTPAETVGVDGFQTQFNPLVRRIRGRTGGLSAKLNQYWTSLIALALSALLLLAICGSLTRRLSKQQVALTRANRHLSVAKQAADEANRSKSKFLADMSHEIRTPMHAILGMTHLVLDSPLEQEQRARLRVVRDSAEALLGLLNSLLDFSKIDAGKLEIESRAFDLRACVGGVLRALAMGAAEKNLELLGEVSTQLPHQIVGDETRLRQTLLNLIGNAIKFTESGEVALRVEPVYPSSRRDLADGDQSPEFGVTFSVRDTGIGIPAEKLDQVFQAFKQADASTSRQFGGTGLGLPISRRLVELMGGELTCASEPGKGSTFEFTLPSRVVDSPRDSVYTHQKAALHARTLIVAEPNAATRTYLARMASSWGMKVDAIEELSGPSLRALGQPDVLLLLNGDTSPEHDPFERLDPLLARMPDLVHRTLVMLTVTVPRSRRQRIEKLGIRCVTKPVLDRDARQALSELAEGKVKRDPSGPASSPRLEQTYKILVVDDSATNRMLAVGLLGRHADVSVAHDGRQALTMLETQVFDLVLMDVQMPVMDGLEATRTLRKREQQVGGHVPVIALTAGASLEDRTQCMDAGMDDFLDKPIRPQLLYSKINTLMREQTNASASLSQYLRQT